MIELKNVSFAYEEIAENGEKVKSQKYGIKDINLKIKDGECIVLCGVSGCGKTSLTRLINGLIPNIYQGQIEGDVLYNGKRLSDQKIEKIAEHIGSVFQNPRTQFFNVDTTSELAFGCENFGMEPDEIHTRLKETAEKLYLDHLMERSIFELSGGEKQRIACGSVYATHPDVVVFDEPSSSLDKVSIERLGQVIESLKGMGKTIVIAEHRLHYLKDMADRYVYMKKGRIRCIYDRDEMLNLSHQELEEKGLRTLHMESLSGNPVTQSAENVHINIKNLQVKRGKAQVLSIQELDLYEDEIVAVIGDNGAGKSTFAHCLCGLGKYKGCIQFNGKKMRNKDLIARSYMVMQDVNSQLFTESVEEELLLNIHKGDTDRVDQLLERLNLKHEKTRHPMSLSGGQKQRVAIASAMMAEKDILIYDEPTSGLDWENMNNMSQLIRLSEKKTGCTIIITHDPELILKTCHRVIQLESGQIMDTYALNSQGVKKLKEYFA